MEHRLKKMTGNATFDLWPYCPHDFDITVTTELEERHWRFIKSKFQKYWLLVPGKKNLTPDAILYIYKSTIRPCLEYCCHTWAGSPKCHISLLDKIQRRVFKLIGPELGSQLEPLSHRRNFACLSLLYRYINLLWRSLFSFATAPLFFKTYSSCFNFSPIYACSF